MGLLGRFRSFVAKEAESEGNRPPAMLCLRDRLRRLRAQSSCCPRKHWSWIPTAISGRSFAVRMCLLWHGDEVLFTELVICVGINNRWLCLCFQRLHPTSAPSQRWSYFAFRHREKATPPVTAVMGVGALRRSPYPHTRLSQVPTVRPRPSWSAGVPGHGILSVLSAPTLGLGSLTIELGIKSPLPCGLCIPLVLQACSGAWHCCSVCRSCICCSTTCSLKGYGSGLPLPSRTAAHFPPL